MTLLLTQMAIVLLVTVACGWLALKLGQARVIGEIVGGILVGPSVFGRFAPHWSAQLFPTSSFGPFETLSTVGLVLFLFLIGMELDYEQLYRQRVTALMASGMSILLPFGMAAVLAHSLRIRFAPHGIGSIPFRPLPRYFHEHHGLSPCSLAFWKNATCMAAPWGRPQFFAPLWTMWPPGPCWLLH